MAFENNTNTGRVLKMIETLDLIEKSAQSNNAEPDAVAEMLRPLIERLAPFGAGEATQPAPIRNPSTYAPQWASVREMCEKADLRDLTVALAVFHNRIDELLFETQEQGQ